MKPLGDCDSCRSNPATNHLTLQVASFNAKTIRHKFIQLALCDACELASHDMSAVDHRSILAKALTSFHLFRPH